MSWRSPVWRYPAGRPLGHGARAARRNRGWLVVGVTALVLFSLDWVLLHLVCRRLVGVGGFAEMIPLVPVTVAALGLNLAVKIWRPDGAGVLRHAYRCRGGGVVVFRVVQFWLPLIVGVSVSW